MYFKVFFNFFLLLLFDFFSVKINMKTGIFSKNIQYSVYQWWRWMEQEHISNRDTWDIPPIPGQGFDLVRRSKFCFKKARLQLDFWLCFTHIVFRNFLEFFSIFSRNISQKLQKESFKRIEKCGTKHHWKNAWRHIQGVFTWRMVKSTF